MARLFLSTDDNAPVIAGNDRTCLVNLLKKCLIEGYGSKAPVGGWTMPYSTTDGRVGVFRNDHEGGGLGHYLRVGQDNDSREDSWNVNAWENMTDENTGAFPYTTSGFNIYSSDTRNAVIRPWVLLASRKWAALFIYPRQTEHPGANDIGSSRFETSGLWFGDIDALNPDDNYHSLLSIVICSSTTSAFGSSSSLSRTATLGSDLYGYVFPRKPDGVGGSPVKAPCFLPHPQSGECFGTSGPAYDANSALLVARAALGAGEAYTLRGWIPEMLVPLHPRPFANLERVEIDGKAHVAVMFTNSIFYNSLQYFCQTLFELDAGE